MSKRILALAAFAGLIAGPAFAAEAGKATFVDASGKEVGTAVLTQTPHGVLLDIDVKGLPTGQHGFHIHDTGKCEAEGGFKSAGGHYAADKEHGYMVEGGPHPGDMPNQFVQDDGVFRAHVFNDMVSLAKDGDNSLLDDDGSAIIIHSGADDYLSQPSGDAGDRIACAVIEGG
ncbi:MAG: superoxide dismutase family protein [Geminicoccaceae bacterium]|nr:superoxide dismutase family protein [Geminicoccaceae bacterium]